MKKLGHGTRASCATIERVLGTSLFLFSHSEAFGRGLVWVLFVAFMVSLRQLGTGAQAQPARRASSVLLQYGVVRVALYVHVHRVVAALPAS